MHVHNEVLRCFKGKNMCTTKKKSVNKYGWYYLLMVLAPKRLPSTFIMNSAQHKYKSSAHIYM